MLTLMGDGIDGRTSSISSTVPAAGIDSTFDAGLEALDDVTRRDGALGAPEKAILLVAGAAVRNRDSLDIETSRAIGLGNDVGALRALALALYLSRGGAPCDALLRCIGDADDSQDRAAPVGRPTAPSTDEMVDQFRAIFGEVPDRIALLARHSPRGLAAYHLMRAAVLSTGTLDVVLAELALMCVNACEHRGDFAAVHAAGARRAGATEEQLVEAGLCAVPNGGVAAWLAASEAIVSTRSVTGAEPA